MIWQDVLIGIVQAILAVGLIPAIVHDHKPPLTTSVATALGMAAFALAFSTLGMWWATTMALVQCVLWAILVVQKWRSPTQGV